MALGVVNLAVLLVPAGVIVPWSIHFLGKTRTVTRTVAPQGASRVVAELNLRSGKLEVDGGEVASREPADATLASRRRPSHPCMR